MSNINHEELAISRLATQFIESTNLINYIKALLVEADTLEQVFQDILNNRWVETAIGVQLDIIGSIVGQSRTITFPIEQPTEDLYFGFEPYEYSNSFGSLYDGGVGKRLISLDEFKSTYYVLDDDEYRKFIRARITRNSTGSTPENIITHTRYVLGVDSVSLVDGNTWFSISIGGTLSDTDKSILNSGVMVKTAGVSVSYVSQFDPDDFFSFGGVAGGSGLGSISDPSLGGKFANLIFN